MNRGMQLAVLVGVLVATPAMAGQVYIYKDASGKTVYSDLPPQGVKNVQQKRLGANVIDTSGYPYEVQQAIKNNPVTLYINGCGPVCDRARALLTERGIPFTEKDPSASAEEFERYKKLTGGNSIPSLQIGSRVLVSFNPDTWSNALSAAGYPKEVPKPLRPTGAR